MLPCTHLFGSRKQEGTAHAGLSGYSMNRLIVLSVPAGPRACQPGAAFEGKSAVGCLMQVTYLRAEAAGGVRCDSRQ